MAALVPVTMLAFLGWAASGTASAAPTCTASGGCIADGFDEAAYLQLVSSKVYSQHVAATTDDLKSQAHLESSMADSYNCVKRSPVYKFFGTAPWCKGSPKDCTDRGLEYIASGTDIDNGANCWSGKKVKCRGWIENGYDQECDPECSANFTKELVGTAPFCAGSDCDCIRQNMIPWKLVGDYSCPCEETFRCPNPGAACVTGQKVLCLKPRTMGSFSTEAAKADCTKRDEISADVKKEMLKTVQEVAKAGASVAAASAGR